MANQPFIPRVGLPGHWVRFLHDTLIRHLRLNKGVVGLWHMTTAERDAIDAKNGDMVYNTDDDEAQVFESSTWRQL